MAKPIGKTFVEIDIDAKKYNKGVVDVKTTTKKELTNIEKAWKGMGKKSEATYDKMRAAVNKNYDTIKRHASSTADDIVRAEKAKNDKIARINKQQFGQQRSLLDRAKKHWMALSAVAVSAVYAIQRILRKSIQEFAKFETALYDMGKVTSESFDSIKKRIRALGPELGTATDLVRGYYQVISAGVTDPVKAIELLTEASKMAKAAHMDQSEVIKALTKVMAGYQGEIKTVSEAADLLFTIEKEGQTAVAELVPIIGSLAAISKELGVTQDELGGSLALVTLTAGSTAAAGTQYRAVLMGLMKPTQGMRDATKAMGYESARAMLEEKGLADTLKTLTKYTSESGIEMAKLFESQEALVGIAALSANNYETLTKKIDVMADKIGASAKAWEDYQKTLNAVWDTFKNTVTNQLIMIGEKLAPAIKGILKYMTDWINKYKELPVLEERLSALKERYKELNLQLKLSEKYATKTSTLLLSQINTIEFHIAAVEKSIAAIKNRGKAIEDDTKATDDNISATEKLGIEYLRNQKIMEQYLGVKGEIAMLTGETIALYDEEVRAAQRIAGVYEVIREEIVLLGRDSDTVWSDMLNMTKSFASKVGDILSGIWEGAGWVFKGGVATIKWLLGLPGGFATAVKNFKTSLENFPAIVSDFEAAIEQLPEVIDMLVDRAPELIEAIISKLPMIFTTIIDAIPRLVTIFLSDIIPAFIAEIPTIIDSFLQRVPDIIKAIIQGIPDVIRAIMEAVPDIITTFIENVPLIINSFIEEFIVGIPDIISAFISSIPEIVEAFVKAIADMVIPGGGRATVTGIDIIPDIVPFFGKWFHKGGIIGQAPMPVRPFPAAAFANAPRAHTGLKVDERLIVGLTGERVLNRRETSEYEKADGGGVTINSPLVHIGGNLIADKQVFDDFVEDIEYALDKRNKRVYA